MIYNIEPLIQKIREADLSSATPAKVSAIGGLLCELRYHHGDASAMLGDLRHMAYRQVLSARDEAARYAWLTAFVHIHANDPYTVDDDSDEDYDMFERCLDDFDHRQLAEISLLTDGAAHCWAERPLSEQLRLLHIFYRQDINLLSHGDDTQARALLAVADSAFEQCRKAFCGSGPSCLAQHFSQYYQVLCLCRPGYRHPSHTPYYKEYFRLFDGLQIDAPDDSDQMWQYREVQCHHRLQAWHHYDPSLLPRLSLADGEAMREFRQWCYVWMLDKDPDNDYSVQMKADNERFAFQAEHRLQSWLHSRSAGAIAIPVEKEAEVLLTLCCIHSLVSVPSGDIFPILDRAYDSLFDQLPDGRLRTHLMAHVALCADDATLLSEVRSTLSSWPASILTTEDRYLQELIPLAQCVFVLS